MHTPLISADREEIDRDDGDRVSWSIPDRMNDQAKAKEGEKDASSDVVISRCDPLLVIPHIRRYKERRQIFCCGRVLCLSFVSPQIKRLHWHVPLCFISFFFFFFSEHACIANSHPFPFFPPFSFV